MINVSLNSSVEVEGINKGLYYKDSNGKNGNLIV